MLHHCLQNGLWCNCNKQEYQGFSFLHKVICDASMISANVRVLLRDVFELLLNILTYHLAENVPQEILKILMKFYPEHKYYPYNKYNTTLFQTIFIFQIIQEKVKQMYVS